MCKVLKRKVLELENPRRPTLGLEFVLLATFKQVSITPHTHTDLHQHELSARACKKKHPASLRSPGCSRERCTIESLAQHRSSEFGLESHSLMSPSDAFRRVMNPIVQ